VCWFGIEQEFSIFLPGMKTPLGWPAYGFPDKEGPYYCGNGTGISIGRKLAEAHYRACMYSGLKIGGCNLDVMPGQWEYQIGPCEGIAAADSLVMSRFLLIRVAEDFGVCINFDPKPVPGKWHGAACHTSCSTKTMREEGGFEAILTAIAKLGRRHHEHIGCYGLGNERRMTGALETGPLNKFSYGIAHRGASVRIPREAKIQNKGYFEDR
jgi:glutamine synthetase